MDEEALPDPGYALTHSLEDHQGPVSAGAHRGVRNRAAPARLVWRRASDACPFYIHRSTLYGVRGSRGNVQRGQDG